MMHAGVYENAPPSTASTTRTESEYRYTQKGGPQNSGRFGHPKKNATPPAAFGNAEAPMGQPFRDTQVRRAFPAPFCAKTKPPRHLAFPLLTEPLVCVGASRCGGERDELAAADLPAQRGRVLRPVVRPKPPLRAAQPRNPNPPLFLALLCPVANSRQLSDGAGMRTGRARARPGAPPPARRASAAAARAPSPPDPPRAAPSSRRSSPRRRSASTTTAARPSTDAR